MERPTAIHKAYVATGTIVISLNTLVFATFLSSKSLRWKYQLLLALAASDIIAGLGTFSAGLGRYLIEHNRPDLISNTTLLDCLRAPWLPLMTIGGQLSSAIVFIIGLERVVAVHLPFFYHNKIRSKHRLQTLTGAATFIVVGWLVASGERLIFEDTTKLIEYGCHSINTYAIIFNDFHNFVIIFARTLGFLLSFIAFVSARRRSMKAGAWKTEMCREVKRMKVLWRLSGLSMLLATLPTVALWGYYREFYELTGSWPYVASMLYVGNSIVNFFIYVLLKKEFRDRFLFLWSCGKIATKSSVVHPLKSVYHRPKNDQN